MGRYFKIVTSAGLIGLAVLHADAIGQIASRAVGTFRSAVGVANPKGGTTR